MLTLLLLVAAATPAEYAAAQTQLEETRRSLATEKPAQARVAGRVAVLNFLDETAFPAWAGTPWDYNGTSTTPGEGKIACGYLVTTVLLHAGFKIERVLLAQQASANIVATLARGTPVVRFTPKDNADALAQIRKRFGDGLFIVGFDYHVGFLRLEGERAEFCHSSVIEPATAICEPPVASGAFVSRLYVVADALNDRVLDDWLAGRAIKTVR